MKYGDYDNVTKDVRTITDILNRQGMTLILEVIAEKVGRTVIEHKLNSDDAVRIMNSILNELKEEILERV